MTTLARALQNQTAPDQSNVAPPTALLLGKPIESAISGPVYAHPRTGLLIADLQRLDPTLCEIEAKQKIGSLRVYLDHGSPEAYDRIDAASRQSASTCEVCAGSARLYNTQGYYQALCEDHAPEGAVFLDFSNRPYASFRITDGKIKRDDR